MALLMAARPQKAAWLAQKAAWLARMAAVVPRPVVRTPLRMGGTLAMALLRSLRMLVSSRPRAARTSVVAERTAVPAMVMLGWQTPLTLSRTFPLVAGMAVSPMLVARVAVEEAVMPGSETPLMLSQMFPSVAWVAVWALAAALAPAARQVPAE